ncbi:hypothetical protein K7432_008946 [Basidiobolus ranarum]|uniref:NodB homology domain-containing protein n=1 Tax=Basidiobolus ranarum TaxID=34480 RepID=A0ABR2VY62_9FUNG
MRSIIALTIGLLVSSQVMATSISKRAVPPGVQISECSMGKVVAVTFDDGPGQFTMRLLDILKGTKVTFFLVGQNVDRDPGIVREMYNRGHHVASHTYTHANLNELDDREIEREMMDTSNAIYKAIGKRPRYMRCPYGECNDRVLRVLKRLGYKVIYWNLDTFDWQTLNTQKTIDTYNVLNNAPSGSSFIALQHDIHSPTVDAVERVLQKIQNAGYSVKTVPQCLNDGDLYA